jgi:serine/threonine-protein kinase
MTAEPRPLGRYNLLAQIATGGMAEIWAARVREGVGTGRVVVVKMLLASLRQDSEFVAMFRDEARITARLDHPNVVKVYELAELEGTYYIVMEYLGGLALSALMKKARSRAGGLRQEHICSVMLQAAAGLHAAHIAKTEAGAPLAIVHRDISPQNLVVTFAGDLKVVDFGIAKATEREAKTQAGVIKGKFAYMSPEQCRGEPLDARSDIFSLGTVMWEVLTGRRLFKRDSTFKTYDAVQNGEVPPVAQLVPGVWPELAAVCRRALERPRDLRYPTAEAMQRDLAAALTAHGAEDVPTDVGRFMQQHFQPEIALQRQYVDELAQGRLESSIEGLSPYGAEVGEEEEVTTFNPERGEKQAVGGAKVSNTFHASAPMPGQMMDRVTSVSVRTRAVSGTIQARIPRPDEDDVSGSGATPEPSATMAVPPAEPPVRRTRWIVVAAVVLALPIAAYLIFG